MAVADTLTSLFSRKQAGGAFTIEDMGKSTGKRFFVHYSTGTNGAGYGRNPDKPVKTIDYAVGLCTANKGDIIYVMPGHTETLIAAAGIDADVEGIKIIGLGEGDNAPQVTLDTATTADVDIDADNITIENIIFIGGIASLAALIDVNKPFFTMRNCKFRESGAGYGILITAITDANANDMLIENCEFQYLVATDGTTAITQASTECIRLVGADRAKIVGNYISGQFSTSAINSITTASLDVQIGKNTINNTSTSASSGAIDLYSGSTGFVDNNTCYVAYTINTGALIDQASCVLGINQISNIAGQSPMVNGDWNKFIVTLTGTSATWNTAASHEIAEVTGLVRVKIIPVVGTNLGSGGNATMILGTEANTSGFIGLTTATDLDAGEIWWYQTASFNKTHLDWDNIPEFIVSGSDIGYTVGTAAINAGTLVFNIFWQPLNSTGLVTAGAGGTL